VYEFVPPPFTIPSPPSFDMDSLILVSVEDSRSIEIKDVKE
jgi:hypothetical protein